MERDRARETRRERERKGERRGNKIVTEGKRPKVKETGGKEVE